MNKRANVKGQRMEERLEQKVSRIHFSPIHVQIKVLYKYIHFHDPVGVLSLSGPEPELVTYQDESCSSQVPDWEIF